MTFTPTVIPALLTCVLSCSNATIPNNTNVFSGMMSSNTPSLQYYYDNIYAITPVKSHTFTNLLIGQNYFLKCLLTSSLSNAATSVVSEVTLTNITATSNIATSPLATTKCTTYSFPSTYTITNATKTRLVNYCQNLVAGYNGTTALSSSGLGYFSSGCLVCTDNTQSIVAPGLTLPSSVSCNSTLATMTSRRRLRFLQTNNTTNDTNNTNTTTPTVPTGSTSFSVCVSQNPLCPGIGINAARSVDTVISNLQIVNSGALFASIVNIAGVTVTGTSSSSDTTAPNASLVNVTRVNQTVTYANWFHQLPSTATNNLNCYWMISPSSSAAPSFSQVWACTTPLCGNDVVTTAGSYTGTQTLSSANAMTAGTNYNIYYACKNNVVGATTQSNVVVGNSFTTSGTVNPPISSDPGVVNSTNTTSNGNYISYSFYAVITILALLFN